VKFGASKSLIHIYETYCTRKVLSANYTMLTRLTEILGTFVTNSM